MSHSTRSAGHRMPVARALALLALAAQGKDSKWYADQIEQICKATGGEFRRVE